MYPPLANREHSNRQTPYLNFTQDFFQTIKNYLCRYTKKKHKAFTFFSVSSFLCASATIATADTVTNEQFSKLSEACAPSVTLETMKAIVATESDFKIYAIGVNGSERTSHFPKTYDEAISLAKEYIAAGKSVDFGLGQINSANFEWLGLTVETVFDPCTNLSAAETVLRDGYERARSNGASENQAFQMALSAYNTGSLQRGFENGYVEKVLANMESAPILTPNEAKPSSAPSWEVFAQESPAMVFK